MRSELNIVPATINYQEFNNAEVLSQINDRFQSFQISKGRNGANLDIDNSTIAEFENTSIRGVAIPFHNSNKVLFNYLSQDGELYNEQLIFEASNENGVSVSNFYDVDDHLLFTLKVENDKVKVYFSDYIKNNSDSNGRPNGWLSTSAECVGNVLDQMTDGSVVGSASALGCMVFALECAVAIGVSCAIMGVALG